MSFVVSCGMVSLAEGGIDDGQATLQSLRSLASRRAVLGLSHVLAGVVGRDEEEAFERGESVFVARVHAEQESDGRGWTLDLATLLNWIKEGRHEEVLPHIGKLSKELQPLVDLLKQGG